MSEEILKEANSLFVDEQFDESLQLYSKLLEEDPSNVDVLLKRSNNYLKLENFDLALQDANKAIEVNNQSEMAYLRKGIALFNKKEFQKAKESFDKGASISEANGGNLSSFKTWQKKCSTHVSLENESKKEEQKTENNNTTTIESEQTTTIDTTDATPTPKYRHDWYQSTTHVTIEVFIKKVTKEDAEITFRNDEVIISIVPPNDKDYKYELQLPLCGGIVPPESTVTYKSTKIALQLKKAEPSNWPTLTRGAQTAVNATVTSTSSQPTKKPRAVASFEKNWDEITEAVVEKDPEPEGEDALNHLFKQIFRDGTDEQKKAMMKSFQESGGTCLSTNWDDVGKRTVEVSPPDHLEHRKYEQ